MKRFALWCWRKVEEPIFTTIALVAGLVAMLVPALGVGFAAYYLIAWGGASPKGARLIAWALGGVTLFVVRELLERFLERHVRPVGMLYVEASHPDSCPCDACESFRRCTDTSIADEAIRSLRTERRLARAERRASRSRG